MISPTVMRGSRLASGSWKMICMSRRSARSASASERRADSRPSQITLPGGRRDQLQHGAAERGLAAAGLADDAQRLARRERRTDAVDRLQRQCRARANRPPTGIGKCTLQVADAAGVGARHGSALQVAGLEAARRRVAASVGPLDAAAARRRRRSGRRRRSPRGSACRLGGWPGMVGSSAPTASSSRGIERAAPWCRGAAGRRTAASAGAVSTTRPAYITHHPVAQAGDHAEVVGDQDDRHAELALQARAAARGSAPGR